MERAIDNALLEKVLTYIPFVVYDGKARSFVLCVHRGYVDATGLGLEHQHVRFAKLLSAVVKGRDIQAAWQALEHSERQALHLACPEMTIVETDCSALKTRLSSNTEVHQLVAFFQFVAYEGHCDMALIGRTWRVLQLVAAAVKGGTRALQWTTKAWQRLTTEEQDSWTRQFGPLGHEPKEMKKQLKTFCSRYVDDHPYLDDLAICEKHYDLLAFHALVQKTIGPVSKMTDTRGNLGNPSCLESDRRQGQCPIPSGRCSPRRRRWGRRVCFERLPWILARKRIQRGFQEMGWRVLARQTSCRLLHYIGDTAARPSQEQSCEAGTA